MASDPYDGRSGEFWARFSEKAKEDPMVPIGCIATATCLVAGLYSFSQGQAALSQKLMRARVAAQGATVAVMIVGALATAKITLPNFGNAPKLEKGPYVHPLEKAMLKEAAAKKDAAPAN
ncbi:hypoxia induced protein conserved region-domain-containing protein [Pelagophyceae sp. CCMP2097]|nr:hypoxia induced protein conserved region-domain-containing protein [Pelagophyceae sp. CCMP2097]